jgi:hypothetical protein
MTRLITAVFALTMVMSAAFFADVSGSGGPFVAKAQTVTAKRRNRGIIRSGYAGGKYVTKKVYRGGKWVTVKTWQGTKWVGKKSYKTGRKVVSRTKKVVY